MKKSNVPYIIHWSIVFSFSISYTAFAGSNTFPSSGNVGIGTTNPQYELQIDSSNLVAPNIISPLCVQDKDSQGNIRGSFYVDIFRSTYGNGVLGDTMIESYKGNLLMSPNAPGKDIKLRGWNNAPSMVIKDGGNVGIGITDPQHKLSVNGSIYASEIKVTTSVSANEFKVEDREWSDFVFDKNYKLPSLDHVESYIQENKHLTDIPSAQEIQKDGLAMVDMMAKQMQKIKELTLYVIELKKQNERLAGLNKNSSEEIDELKTKIEFLEKRIN